MLMLLDINVLIARVDPGHEFHGRCCTWLEGHASAGLATCPFTENGFLRIFGNPAYPGGPGSPEAARPGLAQVRAMPQHVFLSDDISFADPGVVASLAGAGHQQLTDLYLLALAVRHSAVFVTFDRKVNPALVMGGRGALLVVP